MLATPISRSQDSFNSIVVIVGDVQTCCLTLIHHKLIQFIGIMSSSKWKSSYDEWRKYISNWEETFLWLKASDCSESAYCKLCYITIIPRHSNLINHEKTKNIRSEFHQQDKLSSKLLRLQTARFMHRKWTNFRLPQRYSLCWPPWRKYGNIWKRQQCHVI